MCDEALCMSVRLYVRISWNITANNRQNLKAPIYPNIWTLKKLVRMQLFSAKWSTFLTFMFKVKHSNRLHEDISRKRWQMGQTLLLPTQKSRGDISISIFTLILAHSKLQGQGHAHLDRISRKLWQIRQTLLLSTNMKLHMTFQLAYLHLTMVHSKGQGQGHAHFDLISRKW